MGAVWATGFATTPAATQGSTTAGPTASSGWHSITGATASPLAGTASANATPWSVSWNGYWGSTANYSFFTVDLSAAQYSGHTYNVGMVLDSFTGQAKWSSLSLKAQLVPLGAAANCSAVTFDGTTGAVQLNLDRADAAAYWTSVAGGAAADKYCIGIQAMNPGNDSSGTFLRSASDTVWPGTGDYPSFVATVDQAS